MTAIQNNFIQNETAVSAQDVTVNKLDPAPVAATRGHEDAPKQHSENSDSRFFEQLVNSRSEGKAEGANINSISILNNTALPFVAVTSMATNSAVSLTPTITASVTSFSAPVSSNALVQAVAQPLPAMSISGGALQSFVISLPGMADISVNAALNSQGVQSLQLRSQDNKQQAWLSGQQPALEKGISDILGRNISVAVNDAAETKQGVSG